MNRLFKITLVLTASVLLSGCKKVEGPGGSSSIVGVVHASVYDGAGNLLTEYDIPKEDVYIIYGTESSTYNDDVETSYDGSFRFDYLEEGNYQVFVYSKCPSCPSGKEVVIQDVEITEKKSTVVLDTIQIVK